MTGAPNEQPIDLPINELVAWQQAGRRVTLVDCREPWEFATVALPGAVLIPLGELDERAGDVPREEGATVVVYCHHGVRSRHGAHILREHGIPARSLRGGIDQWSLVVDPALPRY